MKKEKINFNVQTAEEQQKLFETLCDLPEDELKVLWEESGVAEKYNKLIERLNNISANKKQDIVQKNHRLQGNELFIALPEGKLHVYVTEMTPDTKDGLIHLDDDYMKSVHIDLIDKDGKEYQLSKTEYQFTRTDDEDENGNKIWMERFWVTGKDIEPPIDIADLKNLSPEEALAESKRVSSKEYVEMVKGYFTR